MAITRWDPFRELEDMSGRLNRLFNYRQGETSALANLDWAPVVDIKETPESFTVSAELPGMKKEDVHVEIEDGLLSIRGERKQEKEEKGDKFHRIERSYGSFMRSFRLPENVTADKADAAYKDGVLTVKLMKTAKKDTKPNRIQIH